MYTEVGYARKQLAHFVSTRNYVDDVIHWLKVLAKLEPEGVAYCECNGIELYATPDRDVREIRAFYDRSQIQVRWAARKVSSC